MAFFRWISCWSRLEGHPCRQAEFLVDVQMNAGSLGYIERSLDALWS